MVERQAIYDAASRERLHVQVNLDGGSVISSMMIYGSAVQNEPSHFAILSGWRWDAAGARNSIDGWNIRWNRMQPELLFVGVDLLEMSVE